jgi:hypothetical protein
MPRGRLPNATVLQLAAPINRHQISASADGTPDSILTAAITHLTDGQRSAAQPATSRQVVTNV